ncbi:binding domain-containing protein [Diplodia corticola]|uniref:Binding domain-containing protein n=1 Tax=Diplodia corticola TaxID=236234 RepID=A0A1J9RNV0_9PEZI|nr:binding domain-containing protein [Diplodia corticola]OJD29604.1 binding domain-containing protein [Diplodia corticola]
MEAAFKTFFTSPRFAVAGASSDRAKFGHKVFVWYLHHSLPVTPINPGSSSITALSKPHTTSPSPAALPSPSETALSVITPPPVTLQLLQEAKEVGIRAVWLQPGTFDDKVLEFAEEAWPGAVIAGGKWGRNGGHGEGWCVLVDGEEALAVAGRDWSRL